MKGSRVRRPLSWLVLSLLLLLPAWACQAPDAAEETEEAEALESESDRTREIEEKAAEIARKEEEIRNMEGSEQDKIDAYNELEEMRRELLKMQEDSGTSEP